MPHPDVSRGSLNDEQNQPTRGHPCDWGRRASATGQSCGQESRVFRVCGDYEADSRTRRGSPSRYGRTKRTNLQTRCAQPALHGGRSSGALAYDCGPCDIDCGSCDIDCGPCDIDCRGTCDGDAASEHFRNFVGSASLFRWILVALFPSSEKIIILILKIVLFILGYIGVFVWVRSFVRGVCCNSYNRRLKFRVVGKWKGGSVIFYFSFATDGSARLDVT